MTRDSDDRRDASLEGALRCSGVDLTLSVDDVWVHEWAAAGLEQLSVFLTSHAAFDEFRSHRDNVRDGHDGS